MVRRRTILKGGITIGASALIGGIVSGQSANELAVHDFDGSAWPGQNDLGNWAGAGSFANGGGSGETTEGALRLEYDNAGWFVSNVRTAVTDRPTLHLRIRGDSGGEEDHFLLDVAGVRDLLSNLTDDTIDATYSTVSVDLEAAGADLTNPSAVRFNFWQDGSSAVEIDAIAFGGSGGIGTGGDGTPGSGGSGGAGDGTNGDGGSGDGEPGDGDEEPSDDNDVFEDDRLNADAVSAETTIAELHPDYTELYVPRSLTEYLPSAGDDTPDAQKATRFDVDLGAIRSNAEDGTLQLGSLGTQALPDVKALAEADFPAHATAQLLPRLVLLPDETEELSLHNPPSQVWDETAGPREAVDAPPTFVQDPWPTDARTYQPEEVRERDRAHDQPQYSDQEWGDAGNLSEEVLYDENNPVLEAVDGGVHPITGADIGGGFTANAPMRAEARMHVENDGYWYQYFEFENVSDVPYHLDAAVLWWAGPSGMGQTLADGHYNNEQRPDPSLGHPQRDVIEVVYDEDRGLSAYAIRLCFHDQPYNMRTAYPNQKWSLEIGTPANAGATSDESADQRQELLDTMLSTLHVELETDMDRNDDLLDALNLRYRVPN